jgi:hypothetical protein
MIAGWWAESGAHPHQKIEQTYEDDPNQPLLPADSMGSGELRLHQNEWFHTL